MGIKRDKPMTEQDFAAKIEWEGGITDALDYGLKAEQCVPGELHDAWAKLEAVWVSAQPEIKVVQYILDSLMSDGEDD